MNAAHAKAAPRRWELLADALLVGLFLLGTGLRAANLDVVHRSPDEQVYAGQARVALDAGFEGNRELVRGFRENPQFWAYPPPSRVGYVWLLAGIMKLTGDRGESAGTYFSCVASVLALLVTIRLGRRFLGGWITVFAALFLAVFPPDLVVARRCWTDAPVGLAAVVMLYLTLEIWAGTKGWWAAALLPVAGSAAVLIKETTVLIYAPCLLAALWAATRRARNFRHAAILAAGAVLGAAGAIALLAVSTGGVGVPFQMMLDQARHNAANDYALNYATGPGYLLLWAFGRLSPLTSMLAVQGLVLTAASLWVSRPAWSRSSVRHHSAVVLLACLTILMTAPYALIPHWLNLRYASASFAPICLFAGAGLHQLLLMARQRLGRPMATWVAAGGAALVVLLAVADYRRFDRNFVRTSTLDLSVKLVFRALDQQAH